MDSLRSLGDTLYLNCKLLIDKKMAAKESSINRIVNNFFIEKGVDATRSDRLNMKVKIIKEYSSLKITDENERLKRASDNIKYTVEQRLFRPSVIQRIKNDVNIFVGLKKNKLEDKEDLIDLEIVSFFKKNFPNADTSRYASMKIKIIEEYSNLKQIPDKNLRLRTVFENVENNLLSDQVIKSYFKEYFPGTDPRPFAQEMRGEILKEYSNMSDVDKNERFSLAVAQAVGTMQPKIMLTLNLKLIPDTPITKKPEPDDFSLKKEIYLKNIQNSDDDRDKKLKSYLQNPQVIKLAKEIESDMEKDVTLKTFAEGLGGKYKNEILVIFAHKDAIGADEMTEVYLAVVLLQKSYNFANAVVTLGEHLENDTKNSKYLGFIESTNAQPSVGIFAIQDTKVNNF